MKWFAYDDYGYDAAMVLDTDMINTRCADGMLKFLNVADVIGCPLFPVELRRAHGEPLPQPIARRNVREFVGRRRRLGAQAQFGRAAVQSQVDVAAGARRDDRDRLRNRRRERAGRGAQLDPHHRDVRLRLITPIFNFNANFLITAEPDEPRGIFPKVRFLHYVGVEETLVDRAGRAELGARAVARGGGRRPGMSARG